MLNNPLLPSAYLAPISYYAILLRYPKSTIEYYEYFTKQSIRNRCVIYSPNGRLRLTVPKKRKGSNKTIIKNIKISYIEDWQKNHWNSIKSAYSSSPFFKYYKDKLYPFFQEKEVYLVNFNTKLQNVILSLLKEQYKTKKTTEYKKEGDFSDLRKYNWKITIKEKYPQVFMDKHGFISNLSILDLLFNLGPESTRYLKNIII